MNQQPEIGTRYDTLALGQIIIVDVLESQTIKGRIVYEVSSINEPNYKTLLYPVELTEGS